MARKPKTPKILNATKLGATYGDPTTVLVPAQSSAIYYDISYATNVSSNFELLGTIEAVHLSSYATLSYTIIEKSFLSSYTLSNSGVLGISEREAGCWNVWDIVYDEKQTFLKLYNTFTTEVQCSYARYYPIYSSKNIFVAFTLLYSERYNAYAKYTSLSNDRRIILSSFTSSFSQRSSKFNVFDISTSERTIVCEQLLTINTERSGYLLTKYNTYRTCFYKVWYPTERWIATFAKAKTTYADQRYSFVQVSLEVFETIRLVWLEVCALSYSFIINPAYVTYNITIGNDGVTLFENETVVSDTTTFTTIPIDTTSVSNELIIINSNPEIPPIYTGDTSISRIHFTQFEDTNTYVYNGEFVTLKDTTFIKMDFIVSTTDIYDTSEEYVEYLQSVGYLKVMIAGEEVPLNIGKVFDVPALTKLPITIYAYKGILDTNDVNISLKWAYPYRYLVVNEILLVGYYG